MLLWIYLIWDDFRINSNVNVKNQLPEHGYIIGKELLLRYSFKVDLKGTILVNLTAVYLQVRKIKDPSCMEANACHQLLENQKLFLHCNAYSNVNFSSVVTASFYTQSCT